VTRIAIDADVLGRRRTGDETYVAALLGALAGAPEEIFAVTRNPDLVPPGVEAVPVPARSQIMRMTVSLPRALKRLRPDVTHFLYAIPPRHRGPTVVTVHDLSFEHFPDVMTRKDRLLFKTQVPRSVRRADRVLTGSEWTKRDLLEHYGLDDERVVVTPYGVDPVFSPRGSRAEGDYVLFVGAIQPRKDPLTALEAMALVDSSLKLVLIGPNKLGGNRVLQAVTRYGLTRRTEYKEYVAVKELACLYRGASALVFPSRYEGFGFPVVEAMASGTPVVATTAGAIPEIAGDAAVLVEPGDPVALAGGIERAIADRERLVAAGLERVKRYRWDETARRTLEVYRELA
jgi:glycosyltransferase involved in cell wall biosynthesis